MLACYWQEPGRIRCSDLDDEGAVFPTRSLGDWGGTKYENEVSGGLEHRLGRAAGRALDDEAAGQRNAQW